MDVLSKLSIKNLKLNRKRTISTIIGIILSVALICAVASMVTSFQTTLIQNAINEYGYYHLKIEDVTKDDIKTLENNRDIKEIFGIEKVGDATAKDIEKNDAVYYRIYSSNKENFDKLKLVVKEGRFPQNSNEIIVNERLISKMQLDIKIGDTIVFNVGEIDYDLQDITDGTNKTFKVVGILQRPNIPFESYNDPYTVFTNNIEANKKVAYISLKDPKDYKTSITEIIGGKNYEEISEPSEDLEYNALHFKYENFDINKELLRWEVFAFSDSTVNMLFAVVGVVMFIIIFTSVFCIRNSFAIATTEKIKMYGMLASVGATKKQIKKNVIFECMILGIIGIPVGIISGILAVFVLLKIVNSLIGDQILSFVDGLIFNFSAMPIIVSIILGIITIYLSAISSAKRASKVSPIESLRGSKEISLNSKNLKTPKIISNLFKTGGVIAYKNLKRSKRKYRTTVTSISVSIFIFVALNSFIVNAFDLADNYYTELDYNLSIQYLENVENRNIDKILTLDNIEDNFVVYYSRNSYIKISDETKVNNEDSNGLLYAVEYDEEKGEYTQAKVKTATLDIIGFDDNTFKKYVKKIGGNYDALKETGILCDKIQYTDSETEKTKKIRRFYYKENDIIEGTYKDENIKIKVGKLTDTKPYLYENYYTADGIIILNTKYFQDIDWYFRGLAIQSDNASKLESDIQAVDSNVYIRNIEEEARRENSMVLVISIFLYGFIAVITLIGITNIFNTITSNMDLRQKEFAMLKSIGMTKREFNSMINLETLFYGTKSWIYGTILGLIGTFAMYKAFEVKVDSGIYIPIKPILISAVFVFIFVFIIMKYSISKIDKQNTIETIRNENI